MPFTPKAGWNTVTLSGVSITSGTRYWLAELGTAGVLSFRDQGWGSPDSETESVGSSLPAAWDAGSSTSWASGPASFYVS